MWTTFIDIIEIAVAFLLLAIAVFGWRYICVRPKQTKNEQTNMKSKILLVGVASTLAINCLTALAADPVVVQPAVTLSQAPSNPPPSTPIGFINTAMGYFTGHNPELAGGFNGIGETWASADYQSGLNVSYSIGLEYNFLRKTNYNFALESVTRNADIAGTIVSEQAGIKWKPIIGGDVEAGFFLEYGYTLNHSTVSLTDNSFVAVGADLKKLLTTHTFGGLRIEEDFYIKKSSQRQIPVISAYWGVTW